MKFLMQHKMSEFLERFVVAVLAIGVIVTLGSGSPSGAEPLDQAAQLTWTFDNRDNQAPALHGQFPQPELVVGVKGDGWRSDGFSSHASGPLTLDPRTGFTASAWIALESYPSAVELPVDRQAPGSLFHQATAKTGFDLFIDTYGKWGFRVATARGKRTVTAGDRFPLYRWVHVAVTYDPASGLQRIFLDGRVVAEGGASEPADFLPADVPFTLAQSWSRAPMLVFNINGINAAYDEVRVFARPLATADITRIASATPRPGVNASLAVPATRFASDHLRPRFHAMPPANWTNEPHGLVLAGGRYHLFYQRTPNGPYKTQMHWGHMSSADLVNWTHHRDALRPELQNRTFGFDQKGIWSGDVIIEGGKAFAYYTSVNHGTSYNPGISVAISEDPGLRSWRKLGPVIDATNVQDFRDPYLWKEDGVWHMIIGAAMKSGGGLDYYRCTLRKGKSCWERVGQFGTLPFATMDIGSVIWEMPVFEEIDGHRVLLVNPIGGKVTKYGELATRAVYWTGGWENGQFSPTAAKPRHLDLIPGHLAPTVARQPNGILAAIGIVDERRSPQAQEDAGWAHTFSLPREWFMTPGGRALGQRPIPALASLREGPSLKLSSSRFRGASLIGDVGHQSEFKVRFAPNQKGVFGIVLAATPDGAEATRIVFDRANARIIVDKSKSTLSSEMEGPSVLQGAYDESVFGSADEWHVFIDGSVVDVFVGNGAAFSFRIYPTRKDATGLGIYSDGEITIDEAEVWRLKPATFDYAFDE